VVAVGPQEHPVFVIKVQAVFGANKKPDEQAKQKFEAFVAVTIAEAILLVKLAEAGQLAQFVLAVPHVPNWASA